MKKHLYQHQDLVKTTKVVFIAMSKHLFYFRRHAVKYVLEKGYSPISQFGIFDYFVTDTVDRKRVLIANNNLIRVSDELWVFGPVSDGVLEEIRLVKDWGKPIRYFEVIAKQDPFGVKEINEKELEFEYPELEEAFSQLQ
jgi:hypothetical protein